MDNTKLKEYIQSVLENMPTDWVKLTTHRLDIYNESKAKTEFIEHFESLYTIHNTSTEALNKIPTAYDYIRLGHPLSCVLEWSIAQMYNTTADHIICFSSKTIPILSILRKNHLEQKETRIVYIDELPTTFDEETIKKVYTYSFERIKIKSLDELNAFNGTTIFVQPTNNITHFSTNEHIDFYINNHSELGSVLYISKNNSDYIADIQHVRRRETIAMTPANCYIALQALGSNTTTTSKTIATSVTNSIEHKNATLKSIAEITQAHTAAVVGSSGLSIQYAIMMGLIDYALNTYPGKDIKFIVPTNCYGGTNDQARRVAACLSNVSVVDLAVDSGNDMVSSIDNVLNEIAIQDAIPFIIAEIPTNPRVEVPNLEKLKTVLGQERKTKSGHIAIPSVFILDQTFCPNVHFLGKGHYLADVQSISYASGSKFPSGGKCTAGYCVGNEKVVAQMEKIALHLSLCDNEATNLQYEILASQLPSMNQRIEDAYTNTRDFVNFIQEHLPLAKINFVSEELAALGFTPSVFSLDLPSIGNTPEEKEKNKREMNHTLINMMITQIPNESKYCVSYGQLKGCYWTIPATSTQGTTKEGDKDYIARVALSANMDLEKHKAIFQKFVNKY